MNYKLKGQIFTVLSCALLFGCAPARVNYMNEYTAYTSKGGIQEPIITPDMEGTKPVCLYTAKNGHAYLLYSVEKRGCFLAEVKENKTVPIESEPLLIEKAFFEDSKGRMWFAGLGPAVLAFDGKFWERIACSAAAEISADPECAVVFMEDSEKRVWVWTNDHVSRGRKTWLKGLNYIEGKKLVKIDNADLDYKEERNVIGDDGVNRRIKIPEENYAGIRNVIEVAPGRLLVSAMKTVEYIIKKDASGMIKLVLAEDADPEKNTDKETIGRGRRDAKDLFIFESHKDSKGRVWMFAKVYKDYRLPLANDLLLTENGTTKLIRKGIDEKNGYNPSTYRHVFFEDASGNIIIGTVGRGIMVIHPDMSIDDIGKESGLLFADINSIQRDVSGGFLVAGGNKGVMSTQVIPASIIEKGLK